MNKSLFIETILEKNNLIEYMKGLGLNPVRSYGHRYVYSCPFHGPEKNPSFFVFTNKEHPNFKCFGCSSYGDVINFVSYYDNCSIREAIGKLSEGIDFPHTDIIDQVAIDIEEEQARLMSAEEIVVKISQTCHRYLQDVNKDPTEFIFMDKVFQKVDKLIYAMDVKSLNEVYEFLVDQGLGSRMMEYNRRQERKISYE